VHVTLVLQHGQWKVDAFSPVGADAQQQQPTAPVPSPSSTGGVQ
jgi:hypothetical protein